MLKGIAGDKPHAVPAPAYDADRCKRPNVVERALNTVTHCRQLAARCDKRT